MGILKVEDEHHQATALTLSSCSNSCGNMVEITQKGSHQGYEESVPERVKSTKKTVRFEEGCNQIIVFTSSASHASKKVVCICAPATHDGAFKCRLHRESSKHRFHSHRPLPSSSPWMVKHGGGRGPKGFSPGKASQHGGFDSQTQVSRFDRTAITNVQQSSACFHQMPLH